MFGDPQFWIFVAFIIFVFAIFKPVKKILLFNLDSKIESIKNNIEEAEKIKNDAQQTLSKIQERQNNVSKEISNIEQKTKDKILLVEKNSKNYLLEIDIF